METIELVNDGTGLGFGIVGGKTTGVIVKTILPGGIADQVCCFFLKVVSSGCSASASFCALTSTIWYPPTPLQDGRLRSGDHILRIGDTDLLGMGSEQVAQVLRQCGNRVKLVVTRGPADESPAASAVMPVALPTVSEQQVGQLFKKIKRADLINQKITFTSQIIPKTFTEGSDVKHSMQI